MNRKKKKRSKTCGDLSALDDNEHKDSTSKSINRTIAIPGEGKYVGQVVDDRREGYGVFIDIKGNRFEGNWLNDMTEGWGKKIYASGDRHEGNYVEGKREGWGQYIWVNGDEFQGIWCRGSMHGQGTFRWCTGDIYSGNWERNKMHGEGTKILSDGSKLTGDFSNGLLHGWASKFKLLTTSSNHWILLVLYKYSCGDDYQGFFKEDRIDGYGRYRWVNGDYAEGCWDRRPITAGSGKAKAAPDTSVRDGTSRSEGRGDCWSDEEKVTSGETDIQEECLHGWGIEIHAYALLPTDKRHAGVCVSDWSDIVKYEGEYCLGRRHGFGAAESRDGTLYEGEWKNGLKHGWGRETTKSGEYEGDFLNGVRHGQGVFRWTNGDFYCGDWKGGERNGYGEQVEHSEDGGVQIIRGDFLSLDG